MNGALGDVRDRSGKEGDKLNRWLLRDCPAATRDQPKKGGQSVAECVSDDDVSDPLQYVTNKSLTCAVVF
jgi:hypothetical protein